jgi:hypothetical protein
MSLSAATTATATATLTTNNTGDIITNLPLELATSILLLVDLSDLLSCSAVCKAWRKLAHHDYLYVPHLVRKHSIVTNGKAPITSKSSPSSIRSELLQRYNTLSATSYFSGSSTLRDLALRDLALLKRWARGVPTRKRNLNATLEHEAVLLSVVIDPVYGLVITGDRAGKVVFWSVETGRRVQSLDFSNGAGDVDPAISAMALANDYLALGMWVCGSFPSPLPRSCVR